MARQFPLLVKYAGSKRYAILNSLDDIVMGWAFSLILDTFNVDEHRCGEELNVNDAVIYVGNNGEGGLQYMHVYYVRFVVKEHLLTTIGLNDGYGNRTFHAKDFIKKP